MARQDERRARIVTAVTAGGVTTRVDELMQRLCLFAVTELAASGSALALIAGAELLGTLAGAGRHSSMITDLQFELGEGPCLEACVSGTPVLLPDLADGAARWPVFTAAARPGVRAEFCFPLGVGATCIGVFDLCRDEPGVLSDEQRAIREHSMLAGQLQAALRSRIVIEQAKGMLAEHLSTTVDEAFQLLNEYARDHNRKLTEVARDIVDRKVPHDALARRPETS